ncbi:MULTISPECIES: hypothetical protein [Paraburkholderia]|uniref:hypothetical protein n=1 Tax=Paraburkholderia TaxID=1822464 RepID=UPI0003763A69|nr:MULTISPECIES: hypothetical protein [Paraburkholderia]MDH6146083.1 hypothetical protein [Paraburkholderia sp. WSM4179]
MFGIVLSALNVVLAFVVRSIIARFFAYFVLYFLTTEFIGVLQSAGVFPTAAALNGAFGGLGADTWYFLDLCGFSVGAPAIVSAYVLRFIIRRIPVIG